MIIKIEIPDEKYLTITRVLAQYNVPLTVSEFLERGAINIANLDEKTLNNLYSNWNRH